MASDPAMVILGLGANVGDPETQLAQALALLGRDLSIEAVSSVYLTDPVGGPPDQPHYLNLVCTASTAVDPFGVLALARRVERRLGRVRHRRNEPRTIDIDILAYDDLVITSPELTIPHPRLHERAFVIVPLAEVAPGWRHPLLGLSPTDMLKGAAPVRGVARRGPPPVVRPGGESEDV